jgi:hypothetical protein
MVASTDSVSVAGEFAGLREAVGEIRFITRAN